MRVDHRGADIFVSQEFLHRANIIAVCQQRRRKWEVADRFRLSGATSRQPHEVSAARQQAAERGPQCEGEVVRPPPIPIVASL
jgi:hypothetical protein